MNTLNRDQTLARVGQRREPWDLIVIGGGATGVGVAMDAASRNLDVLLLEQSDLGKGTSSRSTKLVHGGVRYLRQRDFGLVREALRERSLLRKNAPHLVHELAFLIPCRNRWQRVFYGLGLKVYDWLACGHDFGRSRSLSADESARRSPAIKSSQLRGGVVYYDGQFDDARLLLEMAQTANSHGAAILNYTPVTGFEKNDGKITAVRFVDSESQQKFTCQSRCVINAAGPFCDAVRAMDDAECSPMIAASQGVHLVLPRRRFPGDTAMIVPETSDGRVIFVIPWHDVVVVGTTDTPISELDLEPDAQSNEIAFLLETASEYLTEPVMMDEVLSVFVGIRPLVSEDATTNTASLSRDHVIRVSDAGLITISGGKWTTVRRMSQDCVNVAIEQANLTAGPCVTESLKIHGWIDPTNNLSEANSRSFYGSNLARLAEMEQRSPELASPLHPSLPLRGSEVIRAVRDEMARTIDDVLARRSRCLIFNAQAAIEVAPKVAELMAECLDRDSAWQADQVEAFSKVAQHYLPAART